MRKEIGYKESAVWYKYYIFIMDIHTARKNSAPAGTLFCCLICNHFGKASSGS